MYITALTRFVHTKEGLKHETGTGQMSKSGEPSTNETGIIQVNERIKLAFYKAGVAGILKILHLRGISCTQK
jgi:hypothetical protein